MTFLRTAVTSTQPFLAPGGFVANSTVRLSPVLRVVMKAALVLLLCCCRIDTLIGFLVFYTCMLACLRGCHPPALSQSHRACFCGRCPLPYRLHFSWGPKLLHGLTVAHLGPCTIASFAFDHCRVVPLSWLFVFVFYHHYGTGYLNSSASLTHSSKTSCWKAPS